MFGQGPGDRAPAGGTALVDPAWPTRSWEGGSSYLADPGQLVLQVSDGAVLRFQNVLKGHRRA